jgi:hypothetical protein
LSGRTLSAVAFGTGLVSPGDASPKTTTKGAAYASQAQTRVRWTGVDLRSRGLGLPRLVHQRSGSREFNPFGRVVSSSRIEHLSGSGLILAFLVVSLVWYLLKIAYRVQRLKQQVRELGGKPRL